MATWAKSFHHTLFRLQLQTTSAKNLVLQDAETLNFDAPQILRVLYGSAGTMSDSDRISGLVLTSCSGAGLKAHLYTKLA